jgi:hypothetical protein
MLYGIQIRAHHQWPSWPRNRSHGFAYPKVKEHPANCPLRWRLSNGLGVYLSWLQAGFSLHTRQHKPSVTWSRNRLSSDQWILHHVLKFQPRRAKHHAKRDRRYRSSDQYIRDVLQPVVVPHFDNHPLATRPVQGLCIWMTTPGLIVQEQ